jgi:hypothetical protein
MKATILFVTAAFWSVGASAQEQERPRVFVAGRGTQSAVTNAAVSGNRWFRSGHAETNIDAHDESMEVSKDLQQCQGVLVTVNEAAADYTVMLDRESKQKRGLLRSDSQVEVVNRAGDVIGAGAARTVNHASKDACNLILGDWAKNGRISAPQSPKCSFNASHSRSSVFHGSQPSFCCPTTYANTTSCSISSRQCKSASSSEHRHS